MFEGDWSLKENATLEKRKSFQYGSGVLRMAYNPFINKDARDSCFDFEQAVILNSWMERVRESWRVKSEQLQLGVILEEREVEASVPQLKWLVNFECDSWEGQLKTSLVTMWELMNPS